MSFFLSPKCFSVKLYNFDGVDDLPLLNEYDFDFDEVNLPLLIEYDFGRLSRSSFIESVWANLSSI